MLVFKLWYLLFFAAGSSLNPFLNVIFRRAGLSERQIGAVAALRPWVGLPSGAAFSGVADKWRLHRPVLLATLAAAAVARCALAAARSFPAILGVMLFAEALAAPVTIIVDAAAMAACTAVQQDYSRQRLFGAVGWGTCALLGGAALHRFGPAAAYGMYAVLSIATLAPTARLPWGPLHAKLGGTQRGGGGGGSDVEGGAEGETRPLVAGGTKGEKGGPEEVESPRAVDDYGRRLGALLASPAALLFFATVAVMGFAVGTIESFLFLFLEDLGGSETLMGLTLTVTCVAETAVFFVSQRIIDALGLDGALHLCFAAFLARLGAYSTLGSWGSPWAVLPVETLHGLTFGLTWAAGVQKSAAIAPPGLETTTQSIFQGLMFGVGFGSGAAAGGRIYHVRGPQTVFSNAFVVVAAGWGVTAAAGAVLRRCGVLRGGGGGGGVDPIKLDGPGRRSVELTRNELHPP